MIAQFIDEHRDEFGVEPIVRALQGTAARIAVSSYDAFKKTRPSARSRRDAELMRVISDVYEANYSCSGVRKMWNEINREYNDRFGRVARCTIERLMKQLGIEGVRRRKKRPKTASARDIVASVGSRGDSFDNAMAEALNSAYKAELIDRQRWSVSRSSQSDFVDSWPLPPQNCC